jgi:hypothetical protein
VPTPVSPLLPAIFRHLRAYAEIAGADARDAAAAVARQLVVLLLAAVAALVSILMFCAWLLALTWDGPWRTWTAAGLGLVFAAVAVLLALPLIRRRDETGSAFFSRVRHEWHRDRDVIERAMNGSDHVPG